MFVHSIWSVLPPLAAIALALWTRNAMASLFGGAVLAAFMVQDFAPAASLQYVASSALGVVSSASNRYVLMFTLLIGVLLRQIEATKADEGFIRWLSARGTVDSPRKASFFAQALGTAIFTDTNLSILVSGVSSRGLFDRYGLSRERLAFVIDTTCAPVSVLVLLNGWGAYISGLLEAQGQPDAFGLTLRTVPWNLYPWLAILLVTWVAWRQRVFGPLAHTSPRPWQEDDGDTPVRRMWVLIAPMLVVVGSMIALMWWTGDGDILSGSGSTSVFWSVVLGIATQVVVMALQRLASPASWVRNAGLGIRALVPMAVIMFLAFWFGGLIRDLQTGPYLAAWATGALPTVTLPAALFGLGAFISFTTGTSWGTFALMIPVAVPLAATTGLPLPLLVAASLSGGIFGDHSSPLSDTTILSSVVAETSLDDHVRTQLPYALLAAGLSMGGFILLAL